MTPGPLPIINRVVRDTTMVFGWRVEPIGEDISEEEIERLNRQAAGEPQKDK